MRTHSEWNRHVSKFASNGKVPCPDCGELLPVSDDTARQAHYAQCQAAKANVLSAAEQSRLTELENVIQDGLEVYLRVGTALLEIRDKRLYRPHDTFQEYCQRRWNMTRRNADRLIAASEVAENLRPIGLIPQNESQAREFAGLDQDEQKALAALSKAVLGDNPTASGIRELKELSQSLLASGAITVDGDSVSLSDAMDYSLTEIQHERLMRSKQKIADAMEARQAKAERKAARTAVPEKLSGESYRLLSGDFRSQACEIEDNSIDIILTDPPYPAEYLPLFSDLGAMAARVLRTGASLLVMSGELYLPEVMRRLCEHLTYHWTLAYLTPGGQSPQIWNRNINTFWKPVLWFVKGEYTGDWQGDVIKSERNEKDSHQWQQSESGMLELVKRFSLPDNLILDPFCGSGTTGVAAVQLHRRFIGIDNDAAAIAVASERLAACPTL